MADGAVEAADRERRDHPRSKLDMATQSRPAFDGADIAALSQRYSPAQVRSHSRQEPVMRVGTAIYRSAKLPPNLAMQPTLTGQQVIRCYQLLSA